MQRAWQATQLLQPESRDRRYMNINDGPQSARQKKITLAASLSRDVG